MIRDAKIYVAGHTGMVGSAIVRVLKQQGYKRIITGTHRELDLRCQADVERFFARERPEYVFDAAARVGGIRANSEAPADFFYDNMQMANNLIMAAHQYGVKKFLFLGSTCMYPRDCAQPMEEGFLLTGLPEYTNEGYALAKACGSRLCAYMRRQYGDNFISSIPANAYGPGDSFDKEHAHVIPALIRRFHAAKEQGASNVICWGDGSPLREFLYVDDLADSCVHLMNHYSGEEPVNIGTGKEISIRSLTELVAKIVGYAGAISWDTTRPNGAPRRLLDVSKATALGWTYKTELEEGIRLTYEDFLYHPIRAER